jgi:hypothetical protein
MQAGIGAVGVETRRNLTYEILVEFSKETIIESEVVMIWSEVRKAYPDQWLVIEALAAHTENDQRLLDGIAVIETCSDGATALQRYRQLRQQYSTREFYFVHTRREQLEIKERQWLGVRRSHAANPS